MGKTLTSGKNYKALIDYNMSRKFLDESVFVENSTYARHLLKARVIKNKMIPYSCGRCGNEGEYNDKPLVLQLDHINGVNDDNRIENLRFLCPNCHSQEDTYAAKNRKNSARKPKKYI